MSDTLPEGWTLSEAEELYTRMRVTSILDRKQVFQAGRYPIIDQSESGCIGYVNEAPEFVCNSDTPVTTFANHTCVVRQMVQPFGVIQNVFPLKASSKVSQDFLFHLLRGAIKQDGYKGHYPQLRETQFLTPPLPEQKKIAIILSSVDNLIESTRAQIDKFKVLKSGMVQELLTRGVGTGGVPHKDFKESPVGCIPVGWDVVELKEIAVVKGGKRLPKGRPFADHKTPYPYIRVSDLREGSVRTDSLKYVLPEDQKAIKRYTIGKNDLYISIAGTIGSVGAIPAELDGAQLTENAAKIVFSDPDLVCRRFVKHVMTSAEVQDRLHQEKGTGGGVPKLALFRIESTMIPLPHKSEQIEISDILDSVDKRIVVAQEKLCSLKMIKKALVQDLLAGKIRVKIDQKEKEPAVA